MAVPEEVVDLLADLREHLQDKCEPPVYVSDRRLVKAVALMQARPAACAPRLSPFACSTGARLTSWSTTWKQGCDWVQVSVRPCTLTLHRSSDPVCCACKVAAYTSGRAAVSRYDCLLLQHVLWQRPDEAPRIADWLVARLAVGDSLASLDYSFSGAPRHARLTCAARRVTHQLKFCALLNLQQSWWQQRSAKWPVVPQASSDSLKLPNCLSRCTQACACSALRRTRA